MLFSAFPKGSKLNVLDYGCGNGLLLDYLPGKRINNYQGCDVNRASIKSASDKYKKNNICFFTIDKNKKVNLGKKDMFDAIILIGVLPYMSKKEISWFFSEARKVLKRGGVITISCANNHLLYRIVNIYRLLVKHSYINSEELINQMEKSGFIVDHYQEKGLIFAPLFSNVFVIFFDAIDKLFFRNLGCLGPFGKASRELVNPLINFEYRFSVNYGYTLFIQARNN